MIDHKFNLRQMQFYAALCLSKFCHKKGISHKGIDELIMHLAGVLTASSLPDWDRYGESIEIPGRGNPLPKDVLILAGTNITEKLKVLVENCVEVGIVDMYGESTNRPIQFLSNCVEMLEREAIDPPEIEELVRYKRGDGVWGEAISEQELQDLIRAYDAKIAKNG